MHSIGMVVAQFPPEVVSSDIPPLEGAEVGLRLAGELLIASGCIVLTFGTCLAYVILSRDSGAAGGAAGTAEDPAKVAEALKEMKSANVAIQQLVRTRAADYARSNAVPLAGVDPQAGLVSFLDRPDYRTLASEGMDTVLEMAVTKIRLRNVGMWDVRLALVVTAHARLVRASDGAIVSDHEYSHLSETRALREWAAEGGKRYRAALERAFQALAEYIVDEMLLLADSSLPAQTLDAERPSGFRYTLRPEHPEFRSQSSLSGGRAYFGDAFTQVDSLQPTFRWEDFFDPMVGGAGAGAAVAKPSYELRLYRAQTVVTHAPTGFAPAANYVQTWIPEDLIYSRKDIPSSYHRLETGLTPCSKYFWTFRARWERGRRTTVTEWAGSYSISPWRMRRPIEGTLFYWGLMFSQSAHYLPFSTPCVQEQSQSGRGGN